MHMVIRTLVVMMFIAHKITQNQSGKYKNRNFQDFIVHITLMAFFQLDIPKDSGN